MPDRYEKALTVLQHHARYGGYNIGDENNRVIQDIIKEAKEQRKLIKTYLETENNTDPDVVLENIVTRRMLVQLLKEGDPNNGK